MAKRFLYDVLLSHGKDNLTDAEQLAERLEADGLKVWFSGWEIKNKDTFPKVLKKTRGALIQSRNLVLLMSYRITEAEWGLLERQTMPFRDPSNVQRRFIPMRLDDSELRETFKQYAFVDWRFAALNEYEKLLAACLPPAPLTEEDRKLTRLKARYFGGHFKTIFKISITQDGKKAVTASGDETVRVWNLDHGTCSDILDKHREDVHAVAVVQDGSLAISGGRDGKVMLWDLTQGKCLSVFEDHSGSVSGVAISADGRLAVSASNDRTLRQWDLQTKSCTAVLQGHAGAVTCVAMSPDGQCLVSGSEDFTIRIWDIDKKRSIAALGGHTDVVTSISMTADGKKAISGSSDKTIRVWDLDAGKCVAVLEGHTAEVNDVAISPDGFRAVSASSDESVHMWDIDKGERIAVLRGHHGKMYSVAFSSDARRIIGGTERGELVICDVPIAPPAASQKSETTRYTNAKVVLVGETGVGKTGLSMRLCEGCWSATESTHGMLVSQLKLTGQDQESVLQREVWLWDFAGQPDYRLIHQLYMDETALGILVFDPQDDNPFEDLGHWEKALNMATKYQPAKLLVAARCDRGGITISKKRFLQFCSEHGFAGFLSTGAKTGEGCDELKATIARHIPWNRLTWTSTTHLFKALKDAILQLKDEAVALVRFSELHQRLQFMLPKQTVGHNELRTVIGLMQGQGVLQPLNFGDFVLLQPELINRYASIVVRMAREHVDEMGCIPEQQVLEGRLDYKDMKRLDVADEVILLRALAQTFLSKSLCLREQTPAGTLLVFPSYFRRDKPDLPGHPHVFVTYGFAGLLDEIYATLVVRLSYSDGFKKDQLWKDAADFKTPVGKRVGLAMKKKTEGAADLVVYFDDGIPDDSKVTFIKYVHEHLLRRAENVTRVRTYICPHCHNPVADRSAIQIRLDQGRMDIGCPTCDGRVKLLDLIEEKFGSDEFLQRVREMDERAKINLDNESKELILVGQAYATAGEAGQIFRRKAESDHGIDGEIEFKNYNGQASGKLLYLQLKSGDSYLYKRKTDGTEIFTIKEARHITYWQELPCPVMLVIRSSDGVIRWMNVTEYLKKNAKTKIKQIVFDGECFTAASLQGMRDKFVPLPSLEAAPHTARH